MQASFATGWRQIGICFVLLAAVSMIASTYSIVAVPLALEYKPTRFVLELAMTMLSGGSALLSPLLGNMMDRVSLRRMMLTGGVLLAVGYGSLGFTTAFWQVLVIFAVFVAPANVLIGPVAATVLLSRWFVDRRGRAIGIAIAGVAFGTVVFPFLIQGLLDHYQWRVAYRVFAVVLVALTVPAAALVVNAPSDRGLYPDGAASDPLVSRPEGIAPKISVLAIFSDPAFWLAAITFAVVTSGMKGMITNLAQLAGDGGIVPTQAKWLISIYGVAGLCAKLAFAAVSDRRSPRVLMSVSLAGFASGMVCLTQASAGFWTIALGVALIGLFGGLMVPMQSLLVPRIFGQRVVGRAMGLIAGVTLIALMSTPPLFGLISDVTGSYSAIFVTFAVLAVGVMLLVVPNIRLHPRDVAEEGGAEIVPA